MKQFFSTKKGKVLTIIAGAMLLLFVISIVMTLIPHSSGPSATGGTLSSIVTNPPHGERARDYAVLYEQEGLTALYLGYTHEGLTPIEVDGGYDYAWKNYVAGGKDARLYNSEVWQVLNDGLGYKLLCGQPFPERDVYCEIPYDLSSVTMPFGYEVETVASFYGLLNDESYGYARQWFYNADNAGIIAGDSEASPFRIGLFHTISYMTFHENPNYSYTNRWYLSKQPYSTHYNVDDADTVCLLPWDMAIAAHNKILAEHWNPITMNVTCGAGANGYYYGVAYNYKGDAIYNLNSDLLAPSRVAELESFASGDSGFRLFHNYSGTIYAVRLYDRTLTEAERQRNAFVDLCAFYSINVSTFSRIPADKLDAFLEECGELADLRNVTMTTGYVGPFGDDADLKALAEQNRTKVYEIINECWPK